jgi:TRAP-type transport system periplasmic protein
LLKASAQAESRGWTTSIAKNEEYKKLLTEKGMKIHKPSAKLQADMQQIGQIMLADWLKVAGDEGKTIVTEYNKLKAMK